MAPGEAGNTDLEGPPPLLSLFSTWSAGGRDDRPNMELIGYQDSPSAHKSTPHRTFSSAGRYCRGYLITLGEPWLTAQTGAQVLSPSVAQAETSWCSPELGPAVVAAQMGGHETHTCQLPPLPASLGLSACCVQGQTHLEYPRNATMPVCQVGHGCTLPLAPFSLVSRARKPEVPLLHQTGPISTGTRMCSCRHLNMQRTHTLDTQACTMATHTPLSCMCCYTWRHEHTHMLIQECTRSTWTQCQSLQHGDGFTHTHTHTHNCLCRPTETGNSHTDTRSPGHRHEIATHTHGTRTHTHMSMQTHGTENTHTRSLARWHAKGHTHTLARLETCTATEITPQAHKLSSTHACTVVCANNTQDAEKTNVTWPFKSAHTHRAANMC